MTTRPSPSRFPSAPPARWTARTYRMLTAHDELIAAASGERGSASSGRRVPRPDHLQHHAFTLEQRRLRGAASVTVPSPSTRRASFTHAVMSYSIRFFIPLPALPARDARLGLARFLMAVHEIAIKRYSGDMSAGPVVKRSLKREPDKPFPCLPVTLFFDDNVDPRPITRALDALIDRAESIVFPNDESK